jgi:pyrimidine deaminase RibD-like protein
MVMATAAVLHGKNNRLKNNRLKVPAKVAPKVNLKTVPKPTVKATLTRHKFNGDTIKVIGDKVPVREGSRRAEIFALFKDGMALNEFLSTARKIRGGAPDVQIALDKKYIELV